MKKIIALLLTFVLLTAQLGGTAFGDGIPTGTSFSEMEYVRPDSDGIVIAAAAVIEAVENGENAAGIEERLSTFFAEYYYFCTMSTLARVRYFQNMSDEFYTQEYTACSEMSGTVEMVAELVYVACARCSYAKTLELDCFWEGFTEKYGADPDASYSDTVIELRNRESELISEYYALTEAPVIYINGAEYDLNTVLSFSDEETAYALQMEYLRQYNARFADVYIELVKVRTQLAEELGYESVWDMQCELFGRDFSGEQMSAFLNDTAAEIAPLYAQLIESGKSVEGLVIDEEMLMKLMDGVTSQIGGYTDEAYKYMKAYGLYDISQAENKAPMSFTAYLDLFVSPFSFVSCNSTEEDIFLFSHEFGRFVQMYRNSSGRASNDTAECCSRAMEMLTVGKANMILKEKYAKILREYKMFDILVSYIEQGMLARFEELVYSVDPGQLSAEALNMISQQCADEFGLSQVYDAEYCAMFWSDVQNFYEYPFYAVSNIIAADAAMQIYEAEREAPGKGAELFDSLLPYAGRKVVEAMECAGLSSPFESGRLASTAKTLREELISGTD